MRQLAINNIYDIYDYISYILLNEISANNFINGIEKKIDSLQYFPYRGAIYSDKFNRYLIYKKFLIFYKIHEEEKIVEIKRIIHSNINNDILFY